MSSDGPHDPITFELIRSALNSITDEMMVTLQRTGRSATTTQALDMSAALCDADGAVLDQGLGVPTHMSSIPAAMEATLSKFGDSLASGDVVILNDPWSGGMHLPDIFAIRPIFVGGVIGAYGVAVVHHVDVGGRSPGSMAHDSTEVYQEGLRILPLKLFEEGKQNQTLTEMIEVNVRPPEAVLGDLMGEVAACYTAERRFLELVDQYGLETLKLYCGQLMDYSERITRQGISEWPDGVYEFTDYLDEDGLDPDPIPIKVKFTIHGDSATVDFTGSAPQVRGAINMSLSSSKAAAYTVIRSFIGEDIPNNAGCFRPVEVIAPEGTITNMKHPAASAARGVTNGRVHDAVLGALAQAVPHRAVAACEGGTSTGRFGFLMPDGTIKVMYDNVYGIQGGRADRDGLAGVSSISANLSNVSIEMEEAQFPLRVRRYGLIPDSAGAGKFRGGLAVEREWEMLAPEANFTFRSDRRRFPPYGLFGGKTGQSSWNYMNPDGENRLLPTKINIRFKQGEVFRHSSPGGGGYGDPLERDPQKAWEDWHNQKMTTRHLRDEYGVVIDEEAGVVDEARTAELRARMRSSSEA